MSWKIVLPHCKHGEKIFFAKTDVQSAFRVLPLKIRCIRWLVMKAVNPLNGQTCYFVEKCLPFGSSISCSHFQRFSNALKHIYQYKIGVGKTVTNYLDDFLFIAKLLRLCNQYVNTFLEVCSQIGVPIAENKTEWASLRIVFLGMLLDGSRWLISVPAEKVNKAVNMLQSIISKRSATIKELQGLTGLLNFLNRAVFPGQAFTRRMYAKFSGNKYAHLRQYHHVKVDKEFKEDCRVWLNFLSPSNILSISRPFINMSRTLLADNLGFRTDAAGGKLLGYGCICQKSWCYAKWETNFIQECEPSIEFLELFALCVEIFTWADRLSNKRILVFCDNQSVVEMINSTSSSCSKCMQLIRKLTLKSLKCNLRIFARHIMGKNNILPDLLSRMKIEKFKEIALPAGYGTEPSCPSPELWPLRSWWERMCTDK